MFKEANGEIGIVKNCMDSMEIHCVIPVKSIDVYLLRGQFVFKYLL